MDGNGRWAHSMNKPRTYGHRKGSQTARNIVKLASDLKIKHLTLYTFSKENWNRPKHEVNALMSLLIEALNKGIKDLLNNNIRLNIIGDLKQFPKKIVKNLENIMKQTEYCEIMTVHLALNYGARWEIIEATKNIAKQVKDGKLDDSKIDCTCFAQNLNKENMPDPDVFIRTGGEYRISNFLLWQIAYTELFFTKTLWPAFDENEFLEIIHAYQQRERRYGLISSQINKI